MMETDLDDRGALGPCGAESDTEAGLVCQRTAGHAGNHSAGGLLWSDNGEPETDKVTTTVDGQPANIVLDGTDKNPQLRLIKRPREAIIIELCAKSRELDAESFELAQRKKAHDEQKKKTEGVQSLVNALVVELRESQDDAPADEGDKAPEVDNDAARRIAEAAHEGEHETEEGDDQ